MSSPVLHRYKVLKPIGIGGMAHILLAERSGARGSFRRVVLKQILPALAREPSFVALFAHEAKVAMQLSHANVVQVFDFTEAEGECVLEMEYVEGCDLRALLRAQGPLPLTVALLVSIEVLKGLDYAHRRTGPDGAPLQIVHRDVSPGNILLSREGEVKVTDFGLSRSREKLEKSVGGVQGTFAFMAPEQAEGAVVTPRADLFSAGALLYAMLAGSGPFEGDGPAATLDRVRAGVFVPIGERVPGMPPALDALLRRALSREAGGRFSTAASMREALEGLVQELGLRLDAEELGRRVRALVPAEPAAAPASADPPATPVSEGSDPPASPLGGRTHRLDRRARGGPKGWAGAAVLALALMAATAGLLWRSGPIAAEPPLPRVLKPLKAGSESTGLEVAAAVPDVLAVPPAAGAEAQRTGRVPEALPMPGPGPSAPVARPDPVLLPLPRPPRPSPGKTQPARIPGLLTITVDPWAHVTIDGRPQGTTPLRDLALSPGTHEVVLENPPLGAKTSKLVRLQSGEHANLSETFTRSNP